MEILRFLLSFFGGDDNKNLSLNKIIESLTKDSNGLDFIKNLNLDSIKPILESFLSFTKNERPPQADRRFYGLEPVSLVADKDIIYALNLYFGNA